MLINIYHLSLGKRFVFIHRFENWTEIAKKCIEEAFDSLNIRRESMKLILNEDQERAIKELISM